MAGVVDCLIFSKDRPAQLDLLLRSIDRYARGLYRTIFVLWTVSAPEYLAGYRELMRQVEGEAPLEVADLIVFWREHDFEAQVRLWLETSRSPVSFLCDDDVFYAKQRTDIIDPPWSLRGGDCWYPFSLDGAIYEPDDIIRLLDGLTFDNPTDLEYQGYLHRERLSFTRLNHAGLSCLVGWPLNRVSSSQGGMPSLGVHEYDLNERFLAGERLEFPDVPPDVGTHLMQVPVLR